jgi:hypothetical protein
MRKVIVAETGIVDVSYLGKVAEGPSTQLAARRTPADRRPSHDLRKRLMGFLQRGSLKVPQLAMIFMEVTMGRNLMAERHDALNEVGRLFSVPGWDEEGSPYFVLS